MSDFRSLLTSFQAATGTSQDGGKKSNKTPNIPIGRTLKENIRDLWRRSQIQKSIGQGSSTYKPDTKDSNLKKIAPIHIAVCATIVSTLPHETIWRSWMDHHDTDLATASMHVHAKTPSSIEKDSWLKSVCLSVSHNPNWNDIRVVKAMLSLIQSALKDNRTTHIMFVTESCIPVSTIDELANYLREEGISGDRCCCSFLDAYGRDSARCTRFDEHACFKVQDIPEDAIYKALPGWCLISKDHAERIVNLPSQLGKDLYPLFGKIWAPEEVFFPTTLSLLGILPGSEVVNKSIMWAKWDERSRGQERAHPIEYDGEFDKSLVDNVRREGCLFMRKFRRSIPIRSWEGIVYSSAPKSSANFNNQQGKKRTRDKVENSEEIKKSSQVNRYRNSVN